MDVVALGLEGLWETSVDCRALVRDVPDAASVAILTLFRAWSVDKQCDQAVRAR